MKKRPDQDNDDTAAAGQDTTVKVESEGQTRRHFSRAALTGSAVLLTLGSGAVSGKEKGAKLPVCVSQAILESFSTASHFDHHADDENFIDYNTYVDLTDANRDSGGEPFDPNKHVVVADGDDWCVIKIPKTKN